jgi:PAS domain-containing protein
MVPRDAHHRWTSKIGQLRSRVERLCRHAAVPEAVAEALTDSVRLCESIDRDRAGAELEREKTQQDAYASAAACRRLRDFLPIACLLLDSSGTIIEANTAAGSLLNTSENHLANRLLLHFTENRDLFSDIIARIVGRHEEVRETLRMRPRERAPFVAHITAMPWPHETAQTSLWFLIPSESVRHAAVARPKKNVMPAAS